VGFKLVAIDLESCGGRALKLAVVQVVGLKINLTLNNMISAGSHSSPLDIIVTKSPLGI